MVLKDHDLWHYSCGLPDVLEGNTAFWQATLQGRAG